MFSRGNKPDSPSGTPYDELPYTYYAEKLLTKSRSIIWGLPHQDAVEALAEAMEGMSKEHLRLYELKGAEVKEGFEKDFPNSSRVGVQQHETVFLRKNNLRAFPHEAAHLSVYLMFRPFRASLTRTLGETGKIGAEVRKEYQQKLRLYNAAKENFEDPLRYAMNDNAMKTVEEFTAEEIRGSLKLHNSRLDAPDKHGEALRQLAIEHGPETVKYYDAHHQALKNELKKNQDKIDIKAVRMNAKSILANPKLRTEISVNTATRQHGESSETSELQLNDPNAIAAVSQSQALIAPLNKGKGTDTRRSEGSWLAEEDKLNSAEYQRHRAQAQNDRAGALVQVHRGRYAEALEAGDAALWHVKKIGAVYPNLEARIQNNRLRALVGLTAYDRALEAGDAAFALFPDLSEEVRAETQANRTLALSHLGRHEDAEATCADALSFRLLPTEIRLRLEEYQATRKKEKAARPRQSREASVGGLSGANMPLRVREANRGESSKVSSRRSSSEQIGGLEHAAPMPSSKSDEHRPSKDSRATR
jgi:hypothetical protein